MTNQTPWQTYRNPHDPTDPEPWGPAESLPRTAPLTLPDESADSATRSAGLPSRHERGHGHGRRRRTGAVVVVSAVGLSGAWYAAGLLGATVTTEVTGEFNQMQVVAADVPVTIRYADVARPQIIERHRRGQSRLQHNVVNDQLVVEHGDRGFTFGWSRESLEVVLPRTMAATTPDVQVRTTTGSIELEGDFGSAEATATTGSVDARGSFENVQARATTGSVDVRGRSPHVRAETTTGSVDVGVDDATTVQAKASTGSVDVQVSGPSPDRVEARTTTGSVDVQLPDGAYNVQARARTGSVDVRARQDAASPHVVIAETTTGSIDVR